MMQIIRNTLFVLTIGALTACGSVGQTQVDAEVDADRPAKQSSTMAQTVAGGTLSSPGFRMQISVGAPQPAGKTSNSNVQVRVGPGAIR